MKGHCDIQHMQGSPAARANHSCALFHLIPYVPKHRPAELISGFLDEMEGDATLPTSLEHTESRLDYNRQIGALLQQEFDQENILIQTVTFGFETPDHSKSSLIVSMNP
jgi:hypothetical protein